MKKLVYLLLFPILASCGDKEDNEAESWFNDHYNYPVNIKVKRDGLRTSILATENVTCGEAPVSYQGEVKTLLDKGIVLSVMEREIPASDNVYLTYVFPDTTINVVLTRKTGDVVIE